MSGPRLIETEKFLKCQDRDSSRLENFLDVKNETHRDWEISWMSRPRLIESEIFLGCQDRDSLRLENFLHVEIEKFLGCRDRDSSSLGNLMDVETESSRDLAKDVDKETPSRLSLISASGGGVEGLRAILTNLFAKLIGNSSYS